MASAGWTDIGSNAVTWSFTRNPASQIKTEAQSNDAYSWDGLVQPTTTNYTVNGLNQYTGQLWLPELGMYYYKARIYSPTLGRFLQTDPIGYEDNVNLYAYVGNDPISGVDPTGRIAADMRGFSLKNAKTWKADGSQFDDDRGANGGLSPPSRNSDNSGTNTSDLSNEGRRLAANAALKVQEFREIPLRTSIERELGDGLIADLDRYSRQSGPEFNRFVKPALFGMVDERMLFDIYATEFRIAAMKPSYFGGNGSEIIRVAPGFDVTVRGSSQGWATISVQKHGKDF